jgi:hypothetical protein
MSSLLLTIPYNQRFVYDMYVEPSVDGFHNEKIQDLVPCQGVRTAPEDSTNQVFDPRCISAASVDKVLVGEIPQNSLFICLIV